MSKLFLPSSYAQRTVIGRGEDVNDITRSVQDGDATVGWRGDSSMDVYREGSQVHAMGFDARGTRYIAATVQLADSDWRRTLLIKLRDGDWQREDTLFDRINKEREAKEANDRRIEKELIAEAADQYTTAHFRAKGSRRHF